MINKKEISRTFHERGMRMTAQRKAILEVISRQEELLTAEDIYQQARQVNPHISLATVYRVLAVLHENRLIDRRYLPGDHVHFRFEPSGVAEHFHFLCISCGRIIPFRSQQGTANLLQDLCANPQVAEIAQVCACVEGYCQACSQKKALS